MNLTETGEVVNWPESHYVFVEKAGPFMQTAPQAWQEANAQAGALMEQSKILSFTSLYEIGRLVYRAGFMVSAPPTKTPEGMRYELFHGGRYSRFVLTGSYRQLGEASGRVWALVGQKGIALRQDYAIENYVNDPKTTPEEELVTEILIPTM
jgi:predicted transcriptional regulator YdeE